jgi:putative transposase
MLTSDAFFQWCQQVNLSHQAQTVLEHIRSSPPTRRVGSSGKNVPVRYPSRKMGVVIQAESHKNEFAGVYEMEHDPAVLEYFDQPPSIKLQYQAKNGRAIGVLHTPDFFVVRSRSAGWEEWKMEEELIQLADKMPHRYVRDANGQWSCPPGEQVATPFGFYYRVRSSADIHWIFQRNLRFLSYYYREENPDVPEMAKEEIMILVADHPGISLDGLLKQVKTATSDDIYTMFATEQLYVDLKAAPLAEPERVRVFCHEEIAQAWSVVHAQDSLPKLGHPHTILVEPGALIVWDGKQCTILHQGCTTTTLLTEEHHPLELSNGHFQALIATGKLIGLTSSLKRGSLSSEARERVMKSDKKALAEAYRRYAIIKPVLSGERMVDCPIPARTVRDWTTKYRKAAQTLGCGYVGLLPNVQERGNRKPRLDEKVIKFLDTFIDQE